MAYLWERAFEDINHSFFRVSLVCDFFVLNLSTAVPL